MKIDDFEKMKKIAEKEIQFKNDLDSALEMSARVPNLYMRYLDLYSTEFKELQKLKIKMDKKAGELVEHFKFNDTMNWKGKEEIESQINRDDTYYNMRVEFAQQEYMVKYLEDTLGNINRMSFSIKAYIDCKKMMFGLQ